MADEDRCEFCKTEGEKSDWIQCDVCKQWTHYECVGLKEADVNNIVAYHCPNCEEENGPSELRRTSRRKRHAIDYIALNKGDLVAAKDRHVYCSLFHTRHFDTSKIKDIRGEDLTREWAENTGIVEPVVIRKCDYSSLNMHVPEDLTVRKVAELVGEGTPLEVMDVPSQNTSEGWTLGKWRDYFETDQPKRDRVRNVISLEFSDTPLADAVTRPKFVRDMDLVARVWPKELMDKKDYPKVSLYCLMSVQDSYTDFHIDFGGSSVFYHVCQGSKTFLFIPPTDTNLQRYEKWCQSPEQSSTFFGDLTKECYRVDLVKGDSLIIPSGWIHAVHTPTDSLVIGGNFLTPINIPTQIRLTEIEQRTKVPKKFQFPHFTRVLWYAAIYYTQNPVNISAFELNGLPYILHYLQDWLQTDRQKSKDQLPPQIRDKPAQFLHSFETLIDNLSSANKRKPDETDDAPEQKKLKPDRETAPQAES
jgi:F-box/leucine-rich repeat protein 10/11